MYIKEDTLDDLLRRVLARLLKSNRTIGPTRGKATELTGVLLQLSNPRARLSRTERKQHFFSSLGELLWYLAGANDLDFITHYVERYESESEDGLTVYGAYGPRLFSMRGRLNQVDNVCRLLKRSAFSRRAVIQLFDAEDIAEPRVEAPCTCTLQFLCRDNRLHMFTSMRSNDAYFGLAHDVFAFTMLQEIIARSLALEVGSYKHAIGSLHLYEVHRASAQQYLDEGVQARIAMPPMPTGDPWRSIGVVLAAEQSIRGGGQVKSGDLELDPYWADLVRMLQVYYLYRSGKSTGIATLKAEMASRDYDIYIEQKNRPPKTRRPSDRPRQLPLFR